MFYVIRIFPEVLSCWCETLFASNNNFICSIGIFIETTVAYLVDINKTGKKRKKKCSVIILSDTWQKLFCTVNYHLTDSKPRKWRNCSVKLLVIFYRQIFQVWLTCQKSIKGNVIIWRLVGWWLQFTIAMAKVRKMENWPLLFQQTVTSNKKSNIW